MGHSMDSVILVYPVLGAFAYFLPAIVAFLRRHPY
jgi:hypothetical protein